MEKRSDSAQIIRKFFVVRLQGGQSFEITKNHSQETPSVDKAPQTFQKTTNFDLSEVLARISNKRWRSKNRKTMSLNSGISLNLSHKLPLYLILSISNKQF